MATKLATIALLSATAIALASCAAEPMTAKASCDEYVILMSSVALNDAPGMRDAVQSLGDMGDKLHDTVRGPVKEMVEASTSTPDDDAFTLAIIDPNLALAERCVS